MSIGSKVTREDRYKHYDNIKIFTFGVINDCTE
jgi:hypothetical protein